MKLDETAQRFHKLRNGLMALVFWNIIFFDIAVIWMAYNGG